MPIYIIYRYCLYICMTQSLKNSKAGVTQHLVATCCHDIAAAEIPTPGHLHIEVRPIHES